jgi:nucleoid DNA-binding protein
MRVSVDWRSASKENYNDFRTKHPNINIPFEDWKKIIYEFNYMFAEHILKTGEKIKLPAGLGEFAINKKKRKRIKVIDGKEYINLPIDWQKTKEKGKYIYNFNYHTEGYFFGWMWFRKSCRFKYSNIWFFKPTRRNSRLINEYLKADEEHQHIYATWNRN